MKFLLDTNVWIDLLNPEPSIVKQKFSLIPLQDIRLCSVVKAELWFGAYKSSRREHNLKSLDMLFSQFVSLSFDDDAAQIVGEVRAELAKKGIPIGPYDLQIAAIALANDLALVTHNTREFSRVAGLKLEDWEM